MFLYHVIKVLIKYFSFELRPNNTLEIQSCTLIIVTDTILFEKHILKQISE